MMSVLLFEVSSFVMLWHQKKNAYRYTITDMLQKSSSRKKALHCRKLRKMRRRKRIVLPTIFKYQMQIFFIRALPQNFWIFVCFDRSRRRLKDESKISRIKYIEKYWHDVSSRSKHWLPFWFVPWKSLSRLPFKVCKYCTNMFHPVPLAAILVFLFRHSKSVSFE